MRKKETFLFILFLSFLFVYGCSSSVKNVGQEQPESKDEVYMFSYFVNNGEDGLHLLYSEDGLTWNTLHDGKSFLEPQLGKDRLMRDPSITQDKDGVFHMVWTTGWWDQTIGYASSEDLINWSKQKEIPVMKTFSGTKNSWAPEIFYDIKSELFYVIWASTIPGAFPDIKDSKKEKGLNHRQYYFTTKDFEDISETKLFFEPGFSVIDASILNLDDVYYLFVKDETPEPAEKNIRIVANEKPYDFSIKVSKPITGNYWAEGPAPLQVGEYVYVYFDKYIDHKYGAVRSKVSDMKNWEDVSDQISFPEGVRHGTAFKIMKSQFTKLK